ncbi:MAG: HD domain-containing protein [Thermoleophilia bacterium]|nr:HD domain-containing protein [Thermoleophilia bacterium]
MTTTDTPAIDLAREVLLQVLRERSPSWEQGSDVGHIVREIGTSMGLDPVTVRHMFSAAELHGIGKVAIPDEILNKPSALDNAEWHIMQGHVDAAVRILSIVDEFVPVANIIRQVFERYDGTGYPQSLAGTSIDLPARIVHVGVAFHAMTVARPYREALQVDEALAQLEQGKGTQFDPIAVDALVSLVRSLSV